jgi:hypothetical protein
MRVPYPNEVRVGKFVTIPAGPKWLTISYRVCVHAIHPKQNESTDQPIILHDPRCKEPRKLLHLQCKDLLGKRFVYYQSRPKRLPKRTPKAVFRHKFAPVLAPEAPYSSGVASSVST